MLTVTCPTLTHWFIACYAQEIIHYQEDATKMHQCAQCKLH